MEKENINKKVNEKGSSEKRSGSSKSNKKNSNVIRKDVKYRVTFLKGQLFRAVWREEGETIELPENDAKAYSKRRFLKIQRIGKK